MDHQFSHIIEAVKEKALKIAPPGKPFILKSGAESNYYLDCRLMHLDPVGLQRVVNALWHEISSLEIDAVGGPSVGADPIVGGLLYVAGMSPLARKLRGFMIRSSEKGHGVKGRVVGDVREGDRCVVIEDVTTTGGSAMDAVLEVESLGAKVVQVYSVVDRLAGGEQLFADKGVPYKALITIRDLGIE